MRMDSSITYVGGIRLAEGGIHLGHFVGSFLPLDNVSPPFKFIYLIKDTEPLLWDSGTKKQEILLDTLTDIMSLPIKSPVLLVTTSSLEKEWAILRSIILDIITFKKLINTHFKKEEIRDQTTTIKLKNFLFPIDEAVALCALRASYVCSNDDNRNLVLFSRKVAHKLNRLAASDFFPIPELKHHHKVGRLLGADYNRMCKANKNTIRVSEKEANFVKQLSRLGSWGYYFDFNTSALEQYRVNPEECCFFDDYLPFVYLNIFSGIELDMAQKRYFSKLENRDKLNQLLLKEIGNLIKAIRKQKLQLLSSPSQVWHRLKEDTATVQKIVRNNMNGFWDMVSA